jgi:Cd2+/Zn2+-exporting ATPase
MPQKHVKSSPLKKIDAAKLSATLKNSLVIRLVIASVIFALSLIITMPEFASVLLMVLVAVIAGYDIILQAVESVENGDFFAAPLVVIVTAVLSFFIGFGIEGTALVLLYQIGMLLLNFAQEHTRKAALELIKDQDSAIVAHIRELLADEEKTQLSIQSVLGGSAGLILKIAMLLALAYAIAMPLLTSMSYSVSIHRALIILLVATPLSIVVSIPTAGAVGLCQSTRCGVVFENASSLEAMTDVSVAVFDKSGIFSEECPRIIAVHSDILDYDTFLNFVAHAVYYSDQPVANAISNAFDHDYKLDVIKDFKEIPGYGVELSIDGIPVTFATRPYLESMGISISDAPGDVGTAYYMVVAGRPMGKVVISSEINYDLENLVPELKHVGVARCVLLSEEPKETEQQLAEMLNFSEMYAQCDTEKKLRIISDIAHKTKGAVLFVYANGIEAHSDAAVDIRVNSRAKYADAVTLPDAVGQLPQIMHVSKRMREICIENALFAFIVKAVLIFLSIIGYCNLWIAVFFDFAAAVATVLNTIRVTSESLRSSLRYKMGK